MDVNFEKQKPAPEYSDAGFAIRKVFALRHHDGPAECAPRDTARALDQALHGETAARPRKPTGPTGDGVYFHDGNEVWIFSGRSLPHSVSIQAGPIRGYQNSRCGSAQGWYEYFALKTHRKQAELGGIARACRVQSKCWEGHYVGFHSLHGASEKQLPVG